MKKLYLPILLMFLFLTCSRDWKNPLDADIDLTQPEIIKIELNEDNFIIISLNHSYPDTSTLILERKSQTAFEQIEYQKIGQSTILDNSFDREINHSFIYKAYVKKGEYRTDYSKEKNIQYSASLNSPSNLVAVSVELQGIRLEWNDNSNNEDSYKIEKNDGSGFIDFATVGANTESYFDVISGTPPTPLQFEYRVKAISSNLESDWINISTEYSGLGSPTNLRITNSSSFNFTIEWDDNSSVETGYAIEKKINSGSFVQVGEVSANSITYSDSINTIGTYSYRVRTKQNTNYSSYSNIVIQNVTSIIPTLTDIDGNIYKVKQIGNQWWMIEDLKVTHFRNGDIILNVTAGGTWGSLTTSAYCIYNNDSSIVNTYGLLYNWYSVADNRNIDPAGWHVATDDDWKQLDMFVGMTQSDADLTDWRGTFEGGKLKELGTEHWRNPNSGATNESGFTALPCGLRFENNNFGYIGDMARWWSSTESGSYAWSHGLNYDRASIVRYTSNKHRGYSIRCVRD